MPDTSQTLTDIFRDFARRAAAIIGSPWAFLLAILVVLAWLTIGQHFAYSDTWQLLINTATTIVTFLTVILIQNTQNRDAKATLLKLDELIHAVKGARNSLINLENFNDKELDDLQRQFEQLRNKKGAGGR
jgi:low affinity Fe/Cu permease